MAAGLTYTYIFDHFFGWLQLCGRMNKQLGFTFTTWNNIILHDSKICCTSLTKQSFHLLLHLPFHRQINAFVGALISIDSINFFQLTSNGKQCEEKKMSLLQKKMHFFFRVEVNIPIAYGLQVVSLLCGINVEVVVDSVAQSTVKRKKMITFFQLKSYAVLIVWFKWFFSFSHGHHWCDPQKCQNSLSYLLKSVQFLNYFFKFFNTFDGRNI